MKVEIPFYNVINMFLVGVIFFICAIFIYQDSFMEFYLNKGFSKIVSELPIIVIVAFFAISYEIGYIINRIGSVFSEPILKKYKLIFYIDNYSRFNNLSKDSKKLDILSMEFVSSRTSLTLFFITFLVALFGRYYNLAILFFVLFLIFLFSVRKFSKRISDILKD